ncbi:endonuclease NucS domain-containing protein, partial [Pseudomonas defluvii]|uniref:endonuclease NucS domain-containing protein n=1 Tax=Pseudomonas defluvii TaxID=1876757 RepID=UPI003906A14C
MKLKESEIRECIAKNLQLLDKNLILIKEEYQIKLTDKRTGFIDILAKDKFGCYTIIEIKKSNQTARSAIQQLFKYASFFKKKNRLESSQIRCLVISTVWD